MKLQHKYVCNDTVFTLDTNQREITPHGTEDFPCAGYIDKYYNNFYPWHWHDEIELAYVETGSLIVSVNNQRYILKAGDGIFINSGVLHGFSGMKNINCLFPNILFSASLIYGTQESVYWKKYMYPLVKSVNLSHMIFRRDVSWQEEILNRIKSAFVSLSAKKFGHEMIVRNNLSDIVIFICENYSAQIPGSETKNSSEVNRMRMMLDFIQKYYMKQIEVKQIADSASISKRECLRCFNNIIGISPKQYVIELRMRKAKELLADTSLSLMEILEKCGFQDQSYFTKIFRERTGLSPGKWRKAK